SGSIERLDLGEQRDEKGVVVLDVGPGGLAGEPVVLPLEATPLYALEIRDPDSELATLADHYPDAEQALVNIELPYPAGKDSLEEILRKLEKLFPRGSARNWTESGALGLPLMADEAGRHKSFEDTVRDYLRQELVNHPDAVRDAILAR